MTSCLMVLVALVVEVLLGTIADSGVPPDSDRDRVKAGHWLGENRNGTRLSWRSRFFPTTLTPKPATGLGKIEMEPVYHGHFPKKKRSSRQNRRPSTGLGKIEAEPVYHGDRETKRDRIGEAIWIGETVWIGETMGDGSCRRSDRRREALNSSFAVPRSQRPERPWLQLFLCG